MAAGLSYNYAAKQVDDDVLEALTKLAEEASLQKNLKPYTMEKSSTQEKNVWFFIT